MDSLFQLALLAASIGLLHTAMGPDHYLPFVVLGRAEGWTLRKTLFWTAVCGVAHVLSSVVLGGLGMGLGWAVPYMEGLEGVRGDLASYALIGFGLLYFAWGLWRGRRGHAHSHRHLDGTVHTHAHHHEDAEEGSTHELREHEETPHVKSHRRTLWALFVVFVLGPCEPLIPVIMVPAASHSLWGVAVVTAVFAACTIGTMLTLVALGYCGLRLVLFQRLERYAHAAAGFAILASGLAIKCLGL